jgi:phage terminase large subunit-like protein
MIKTISVCSSPVTFSGGLKVEPDPWQAEVMMSPAKRILLNCSRQSGKSTSSSIIALHQALYYPGSLILLVSPSLRQSSELFKKVQSFYKMLPDRPKLPEDNKLSMALENGSR